MTISLRASNKQAVWIVRQAQKTQAIRSIGTARNYEQALERVCDYQKTHKSDLRHMSVSQAEQYLHERKAEVGQKKLDMERQAIRMSACNRQIPAGAKLDVVRAENQTPLESRTYTPEQVEMIADRQRPDYALATRIAYSAGLRAHELENKYTYETALRVVSQEMGHFRPEITEVYLR